MYVKVKSSVSLKASIFIFMIMIGYEFYKKINFQILEFKLQKFKIKSLYFFPLHFSFFLKKPFYKTIIASLHIFKV